MGIDRHRVGRFNARERSPQPIGCQRSAAPGGVYVVPDAVSPRDRCAAFQWIDHPSAGSARGRCNEHRHRPVPQIALDHLGKRLTAHAAAAVCRDEAQRRAANTRLMSNFQPGGVAFPRSIESNRARKRARAFGAETRLSTCQSTDQCCVVGLRPAGGEMTGGLRRQACATSDRADDVSLDFDRRR